MKNDLLKLIKSHMLFIILEFVCVFFLFYLVFYTLLFYFPFLTVINQKALAENFNVFSIFFILFISLYYFRKIEDKSTINWKATMFLCYVFYVSFFINFLVWSLEYNFLRLFLPSFVAFSIFLIFSYYNNYIFKIGLFLWFLRVLIVFNYALFVPQNFMFIWDFDTLAFLLIYKFYILTFSIFLSSFYLYSFLNFSNKLGKIWLLITGILFIMFLLIDEAFAGKDFIVDTKTGEKIKIENIEEYFLKLNKSNFPTKKGYEEVVIAANDSTVKADILSEIFKKNKVGALIGSMGEDGGKIRNELIMYDHLDEKLINTDVLIPTRKIISTEQYFIIDDGVFDYKSLNGTRMVLKPFYCMVTKDGISNQWVYVTNKGGVATIKFNLDCLFTDHLTNNHKVDFTKLIINPKIDPDLIKNRTLGDLGIFDLKTQEFLAWFELKNYSGTFSEPKLQQAMIVQPNTDFYIHFKSEQINQEKLERLVDKITKETYYEQRLNTNVVPGQAYDRLVKGHYYQYRYNLYGNFFQKIFK